MNWFDFVKSAAEIITSLGIIGGLFVWIYNTKKKGKDWARNWIKECINLDEICTKLKEITNEQDSRESRLRTLEQVNLIQLKARLKPCCLHILKRGIISPSEFEILSIAAELYFSMGGNGTIKHLLEQIKDLPVGEVAEEDEIF